ncbi:MAG: acyl-CoA dehydrogenase family protein, partial [Pseudomonadota bacterium]|nr:acyl-CoA dehydrogenase family protein [Pseudomonadota bacterium]
MNLQFTTAENAFRDEVRTFLAEALPSDIQNKVRLGQRLSAEEHVRWQNRLNERGWLAPGWPVEHGGTGWSPVEKYIFEEECAAAHAPTIVPFGVNMVAPVIIRFG